MRIVTIFLLQMSIFKRSLCYMIITEQSPELSPYLLSCNRS